MSKRLLAIAGAGLLSLAVEACGGDASSASGTVSYWLWDANQKPAYDQCAKDFTKANPDITVRTTQLGWDDYWPRLTAAFISGKAPDVFADHLAKYPEFVEKRTIQPLDEFITRDKVDTDIYQPGLADLWVGPDGKRYGLPKDYDTVAVFYNRQLTDKAGISERELKNMSWNPTDGGTYEKIIARLTVDKNGRRGDEPGFDKNNVRTYGLWLNENDSGRGLGQTLWSMYAVSNGWRFTDKNPWGTRYNYNDPKFQQALSWWTGLIAKGYMPSLKAATGLTSTEQLAAGKAAMITDGSWGIPSVFNAKSKSFTPALAPLPSGPIGKRMSMFNGLADSIYAGTKRKEAAWKWVKYLASPACQNVVAQHAVVFPAITGTTDATTKAFAAKGVDVSVFTVNVKEKTTFLFPITDNATQIETIMNAAMDSVLSGKAPVGSLTTANDQVNALFK
jgi:multiple sugar transport system substrate-binding protein